MISSTPEKSLTNPSMKRPRIASDGGLDTEAISDLSDLSPIREDDDMYNDSKSDSNFDGYAIFPSFTDVDHHGDSLSADERSSNDSEEAAFYPSHDDTLQSDQNEHSNNLRSLSNSSEDSTRQEQDALIRITETTSTAARDRDLKLIAPVLIAPCCSQQCLLNLTANEVLKSYVYFKSLNYVQQRQWLIDKLNENTSSSSSICGSSMLSEASSATYYIVAGKAVCKTAWCQVLQISPKRVSKAMKVVKEGQISLLEHGTYTKLCIANLH